MRHKHIESCYGSSFQKRKLLFTPRRDVTSQRGGPRLPRQRDDELFERWSRSCEPHWFDAFLEPMLRAMLDHLREPIADGAALLDAGCGKGHKTEAFRKLGMRTVGIDVHPESIAECGRRYPDNAFQVADVHALPFEDQSFDVVFSVSTLQYTDWPRVLDEFHRVLRPGGRIALIEHLEANPVARTYRALHRALGWRYNPCQTPVHHLRWDELPRFQQRFVDTTWRAFHLTTTLSLVLPALEHGFLHRPMTHRAGWSYRTLRRLDDRLLEGVPGLRPRAWQLFIGGFRAADDQEP